MIDADLMDDSQWLLDLEAALWVLHVTGNKNRMFSTDRFETETNLKTMVENRFEFMLADKIQRTVLLYQLLCVGINSEK